MFHWGSLNCQFGFASWGVWLVSSFTRLCSPFPFLSSLFLLHSLTFLDSLRSSLSVCCLTGGFSFPFLFYTFLSITFFLSFRCLLFLSSISSFSLLLPCFWFSDLVYLCYFFPVMFHFVVYSPSTLGSLCLSHAPGMAWVGVGCNWRWVLCLSLTFGEACIYFLVFSTFVSFLQLPFIVRRL